MGALSLPLYVALLACLLEDQLVCFGKIQSTHCDFDSLCAGGKKLSFRCKILEVLLTKCEEGRRSCKVERFL